MNSVILAGSLLLAFEGTTQMTQETDYGFEFKQERETEVCCSISQQLDLNEFPYVETTEEVELGFDTATYLPEDFDPYVGSLSEIAYTEAEDSVELGFETEAYLPEGFDPHVGNLKELAFVEEETTVELGFDTSDYLPKGFDPHVGNLNDILYIDLTKEELSDCEFGLWVGMPVNCKTAGIKELIASPSAATLVAVR